MVDIALFPREFRARHVLRVGEQKTHTIHFLFHGPGAQPDLVAAASLARPLIALADPAAPLPPELRPEPDALLEEAG